MRRRGVSGSGRERGAAELRMGKQKRGRKLSRAAARTGGAVEAVGRAGDGGVLAHHAVVAGGLGARRLCRARVALGARRSRA